MSVAADQTALTRRWLEQGRRFAIALLVDTEGSSPFDPGAFMLIDVDGNVEGSITGGCVESDVVDQALALLEGGAPAARLVTYGVSDELAQSVGLMCGGTVHVLVHAPTGADREALMSVFTAVDRGQPAAVATLLDGPHAGAKLIYAGDTLSGGLGEGELLDHNVGADLRGAADRTVSRVRRYGAGGETLGDNRRVHIQSFLPPPAMVIVGAIDYAAALAPLAALVGYAVTIVDARPTFAASPRFSAAAEVLVGWPQEILPRFELGPRDALLVFSHDPKFDEPALTFALESGAGYIGALGSRRTTEDRRRRLGEEGVSEAALDRIHSPCGLDIGAASPEEVAVSILAEIIASQNARHGGPLAAGSGPIRDARSEPVEA